MEFENLGEGKRRGKTVMFNGAGMVFGGSLSSFPCRNHYLFCSFSFWKPMNMLPFYFLIWSLIPFTQKGGRGDKKNVHLLAVLRVEALFQSRNLENEFRNPRVWTVRPKGKKRRQRKK